jgi:DNA-binding NtrC family response regulator
MKKPQMKVLICEDDEGIREVLTVALKNEGFHPIPVDDQNKMRDAVSNLNPRVVLLDLTFARGASGEEILDAFQRNPSENTPRIILMSAHAKLPEIARRFSVDYIMKPFDLTDLVSLITRNGA